jgi:hypothetical protein
MEPKLRVCERWGEAQWSDIDELIRICLVCIKDQHLIQVRYVPAASQLASRLALVGLAGFEI